MIPFLMTTSFGAPTEDIRDIRGWWETGIPVWVWWTAGGLLVSAALAGAFYWWWKQRKARLTPDSDETIALRNLDHAQTLIQPGAAREFCAAVSDIIRVYIGQRFQIPVVRETTQELVRRHLASAESPLHAYAKPLGQFLDLCDLAKFARGELAVGDMERVLDQARLLVESMRPAPQDGQKTEAAP